MVLDVSRNHFASLLPHLASHYQVVRISTPPQNVWILSSLANQHRERGSFQEFHSKVRGEPTRRVLYDLGRKIILINEATDPWLSIFLCRMLRDLLRWEMLSAGVLFLHGGMVTVNGTGIAILGPPKSGKTSTSLALLGTARACHVAENDLVVAHLRDKAVGLGWPRSMCIRSDTLDAFDQIFPALRQGVAEATHPYSGRHGTDGIQLFHLLPSEIAQVSHHEIKEQAKLDMIVFPRFVKEEEEAPHLERVSNEEAISLLMDNWDFIPERSVGASACDVFCGTQHWRTICFNPFLVDSFRIPTLDALKPALLALARLVPCYLLRQNLAHLGQSCALLIAETESPRERAIR